jgi:hypothetical protein
MQIKYGAFVNVEAQLVDAQLFGHETVVLELLVKGTSGSIAMSKSEASALVEMLTGALKAAAPTGLKVNLGPIKLKEKK